MTQSAKNTSSSSKLWLGALLITVVALWFRFPRISANLPYFYQEDEGHHFNRVVDMVKSGDLNPHYFHKPSLHFYLRIPVVMASFLWEVRKGHIRKIEQIRTHDKFGLAGYAFTASHPGIVEWNRSFSVLLSLLAVFLAFLIAKCIGLSPPAALGAALLVGVSPPLIADSAKIGVDVVMLAFSLGAVYVSLKLFENYSGRMLWTAGIAAGLAVSTKYNALPVAFLPLAALLLSKKTDLKSIVVSIVGPAAGFFLGSPCILTSIPLFLNHLGYEIWHYGVAGHTGHSAEPGLPQAIFYFKWLAKSGAGFVAFGLSAAGTVAVLLKRDRKVLLISVFPFLYFLLMISQRVNFERNILVLIPFVFFLALYAADIFSKRCGRGKAPCLLALVAVSLLQPLWTSLSERSALAAAPPDTRSVFESWILNTVLPGGDTALSSQLLFSPGLYTTRRNYRLDEQKANPKYLYLAGFDYIAASAYYPFSHSSLIKLKKTIHGVREKQRIIKSPEINFYEIDHSAVKQADIKDYIKEKPYYHFFPELLLGTGLKTGGQCYDPSFSEAAASESYCWTRFRIMFVKLDAAQLKSYQTDSGDVEFTFNLMSPWKNQRILFSAGHWSGEKTLKKPEIGQWIEVRYKIPLSQIEKSGGLFIETALIHSPLSEGLSSDVRRLGAAVESVRIG